MDVEDGEIGNGNDRAIQAQIVQDGRSNPRTSRLMERMALDDHIEATLDNDKVRWRPVRHGRGSYQRRNFSYRLRNPLESDKLVGPATTRRRDHRHRRYMGPSSRSRPQFLARGSSIDTPEVLVNRMQELCDEPKAQGSTSRELQYEFFPQAQVLHDQQHQDSMQNTA
jgi:hypothetical protein